MLHFNDEYKSIKENYLEKIKKYTEGRYKQISTRVINDIVAAETKKKSDQHTVEAYLDQALDFLFDLRSALNHSDSVWNKNEKIDNFYKDCIEHKIKRWKYEENKILISSVNELISKYISYDWYSPALEWFKLLDMQLKTSYFKLIH